MLTAKTIGPQQGISYYTKESEPELLRANSNWTGQAAKTLNLSGEVGQEEFSLLLTGHLPTGEKFRQRQPPRRHYQERAGLDCTFSAPKSVSILALVKKEQDLIEAHQSAIATVLNLIESRYAQTRRRVEGIVRVENTGNLAIAQFHHFYSRQLDPQLHTHCLLLNATQTNKKWYALRDDEIFRNLGLLGRVYQNELAYWVKTLGYEIVPSPCGQFEIAGFEPEQLQGFSRRRSQIIESLKEGPLLSNSWHRRQQAALLTRPYKEIVPLHQLLNGWSKRATELEIAYPRPQFDNQLEDRKAIALDRNKSSKSLSIEELERIVLNNLPLGAYPFKAISNAIAISDLLLYSDRQVYGHQGETDHDHPNFTPQRANILSLRQKLQQQVEEEEAVGRTHFSQSSSKPLATQTEQTTIDEHRERKSEPSQPRRRRSR
ncbi:MobF family relaxase [Gloeothece verrucosa]|uniref:Conjugative relaxase domain protein n=1 Tax=Gloeothece verrucosa (strain PCC 7822) TaxID=497965 RepID=E0UMP3_GLOV7|nr:MobF family relaxase [Gloeothece verrucosa]ADN18223.1 conjugative relaxase domain protein [Gloeothece verrucosa PCC 7822]